MMQRMAARRALALPVIGSVVSAVTGSFKGSRLDVLCPALSRAITIRIGIPSLACELNNNGGFSYCCAVCTARAGVSEGFTQDYRVGNEIISLST